MDKKYYVIATTNEYGLTIGKQYIVESAGYGSVYVYGINGDYLTHCRKDSFDKWKPVIE